MAMFNTNDIKNRLNNIKIIYQEYLGKIGNIRKKEKVILADFIKKDEEEKIAEIRRSIQ